MSTSSSAVDKSGRAMQGTPKAPRETPPKVRKSKTASRMRNMNDMGIEKADKGRGGEFRTILRQQVSSLYGSMLVLDRIGLVSLHIRLH